MKYMKKIRSNAKQVTRLFSLLLGALILTTGLVACSSETAKPTDPSGSKQDGLTIGVIQFAHHASLDNCYDGLIQGLAEAGYKEGENLSIDHQIANADPGVANQIAKNMASRKVDLIVGIATPAAQAAYNAAKDQGIPTLFTAVTDPILAGLQQEDGSNLDGVTGTSDALPVDAQLQLMRAFFPEAKNVGILYSLSESNSLSSIETYKELAAKYDFTIVTEGVSEASIIPAATDSLLQKVDVLTNLTDNMVVDNMPVVLKKANELGIPLFGSEEEQVKNGAIAAEGLDYVELGRITGQMGAKVLGGTAAKDVAIQTIDESLPFHNAKVMETFDVTLPAGYENSTDMSGN